MFTFEAVARLGSFSHAAKELNVTQPAISRSISSFEMHLGYALFERHGRWIKLTSSGDKLFRATTAAFDTISSSMMEIEQLKGSLETISISMSPTAINYWFVPRLAEFKEKFPTINLNFLDYNSDTDGLVGGVDLGIRLSNPLDADMHRWPFADERIIALCSRSYLRDHGPLDNPNSATPAANFIPHTFVEWSQQRFGLDEYFYATGLTLPDHSNFVNFANYSSVMQSAIEGHGIALAWINEASKQIIDGTLVPACAQVIKTGRRYHILASNLTPMRPAVEEVRDWLISQMRMDQKKLTSILKSSWDLF